MRIPFIFKENAKQTIARLNKEKDQLNKECQRLYDKLLKYETLRTDEKMCRISGIDLKYEQQAGGYKLSSIRNVLLPDNKGQKHIVCYVIYLETPYPTRCLYEYRGIKNTIERIKDDLIKGGILDSFGIDGYVEQRDSLIYNYDAENETYENNEECQYCVSALASEIWINSYNLDSGNVECNFLVIGDFRLPCYISSFITKEQKEFGAEGYERTNFTYTPKEDQANEIKADTETKATEDTFDTFCFIEPDPITSPQENSKAEPEEQKINADDLSSSETNGFIAILNQAAKSPAEEKPDASIAEEKLEAARAQMSKESARARARAEERARQEAEREAMKQERKAQRIAKKQTNANEEAAKLTNNKSAGRKSKKPAPEKLLTEYETLTAKELAKKYKVNVSTVRRWIKDARALFKNTTEQPEPLAKRIN